MFSFKNGILHDQKTGKAGTGRQCRFHDYTQPRARAARDDCGTSCEKPGKYALSASGRLRDDALLRTDCYTNPRMHRTKQKRGVPLLAASALLLLTATAAAQAPKPLEISPGELVRLTVANEVAAANNTSTKHMFRSRKQTPKGSQTRLYVETNDAMAGMLVATNDEPLTAQQQQGEMNHLAWLMGNPEQLRKKQAQEKKDADETLRIVRALPDAFRYVYAGTGNPAPGPSGTGSGLVRLNFTPNPAFSPPSHVEQVLEGMEGFLLIDPQRRRIARIDGTLFKDVTFAWGILGRLDKGGHFRVLQGDLGDGTWDIKEMDLNITGKILLFKTIAMVSDEVFSDFRRVPDNLTFAQGVELLKAEEQKLAQHSDGSESSRK